MRRTIRQALSHASSFDEFSSLLLREGVTVKESRGRLSYLSPDRTKPITARKLGDDFDRTAVLAMLEKNAHRAAEKTAAIAEYPAAVKEPLQRGKTVKTAPNHDGIQRMVDIEAKKAEGKGRGYERWAAPHNLKQAAASLAVYEQSGFSSLEELEAALTEAHAGLQDTTAKLKILESTLSGKKELRRQILAFAKTKPVREGLKAQKSDKARQAYREQHESDFIIATAAARYFKEQGYTKKLLARKDLQAEIEQLTTKKNALYCQYREKKERVRQTSDRQGQYRPAATPERAAAWETGRI